MEQQEQAEWDCVNKLLQNGGFKPVHFADPVENKNISDLVLLDRRAAAEVRATMRTMLGDSERRQALIQELVQSNNVLKEEAQELIGQAGRHSQRAAQLETLLDGVRAQVQDLEGRCLAQAVQRRGHAHRLEQDALEAQSRCLALELQLTNERAARADLQRKLCFAVREEERRVERQTLAFQRHVHPPPPGQPAAPADQRVLDVIDFYETQVAQLQEELSRSLNGGLEGSQASDTSGGGGNSNDVISSLKAALMSSQAQLEETKAQRDELTAEVQNLQKELKNRPTLKDLKTFKHQQRLMERWIQRQSRLPSPGPDLAAPPPAAPGAGAPCTLGAWTNQVARLTDLHAGLRKLSHRLAPWRPADDGAVTMETVKVEDLMLLVDAMLEETASEDENALRPPTRHALEAAVGHFQTLFDVDSLRGVCPRMSALHTRLGAMSNAMSSLRDALQLDNQAPPGAVVSRVAQLAQYHGLLAEGDIQSILLKVKEHEEFFPAFHSLVTQLMEALEVDRLSEILPALTSLKLKSE